MIGEKSSDMEESKIRMNNTFIKESRGALVFKLVLKKKVTFAN